jgi:hypothetical protein
MRSDTFQFTEGVLDRHLIVHGGTPFGKVLESLCTECGTEGVDRLLVKLTFSSTDGRHETRFRPSRAVSVEDGPDLNLVLQESQRFS